jgi:hypothetical protein
VDALPELFILRPAIPGTNDIPVLIGKLCFVFSLMVAVMIKTQFFLLYFWQIFSNISKMMSKKEEVEEVDDLKQKIIENKSTITQRMLRDSEDNIHIKTRTFDHLTESEDEDEDDNIEEEKKVFVNVTSNYEISENSNSNIETKNLKNKKKSEKQNESQGGACYLFKNFIVLLCVTVLTIILKDSLSTVLSILGSFVGIFELTIFPFCMVLIINRRIKIISNMTVVFIYIIMITFTLFGFASFVLTFFVKDKVH